MKPRKSMPAQKASVRFSREGTKRPQSDSHLIDYGMHDDGLDVVRHHDRQPDEHGANQARCAPPKQVAPTARKRVRVRRMSAGVIGEPRSSAYCQIRPELPLCVG